ncbi:Piso0_000118 [Millerozyma farinosa CBS 7064]|uniref:DNA-directed RNA polymerase III subunit RPC9 n=1 Tax=Pichia sorbitophila (strain ATCC MYA-4447 / BCRC 22081 / CBS 7064 / NBRC 10061 / NRRL Y-12695) TaxID=559304 RepID=G8YUK3_PICSO|nr:Piso0_000118 [Millerozyma farinosa CBS 7064]
MQIINERDCFLSNYEVLKHLEEMKLKYNWTEDKGGNDNRKKKKRFTGGGIELEVITNEVSEYLKNSPCSEIKTDDDLVKIMTFLNGFDLVKVEKLQIINCLPRTMVHLYSLIEECDQRFDQEVCEKILSKIEELFPSEEAHDDQEEDGQEEEEEQFQDAENE